METCYYGDGPYFSAGEVLRSFSELSLKLIVALRAERMAFCCCRKSEFWKGMLMLKASFLRAVIPMAFSLTCLVLGVGVRVNTSSPWIHY